MDMCTTVCSIHSFHKDWGFFYDLNAVNYGVVWFHFRSEI